MENTPAGSTIIDERTGTTAMPEESRESDEQSAASDFDVIESNVDHDEGICKSRSTRQRHGNGQGFRLIRKMNIDSLSNLLCHQFVGMSFF